MSLCVFKADLHLHTCLSPCGELEMTPMKIVERCRREKLDTVAVSDHNSAKNVAGVSAAAGDEGPRILAGMEVSTAEEVHILALFDRAAEVLTLQDTVYNHLLPGRNDDELFGMQVVANENDEVEYFEYRLLIGGTTLTVEEVVGHIHALNGLAVASHVDRGSYSLISQLGFIPEGLALDALEVSPRGDLEEVKKLPGAADFPLIRSSDAHRLDDIGRVWTEWTVAEMTTAEMRLALKNQEGRKVVSRMKTA